MRARGVQIFGPKSRSLTPPSDTRKKPNQNGFLSLVLGSFDGFQAIWVPKTQNWFWSFPHLKLERCPIDYLYGTYTASFSSIGGRPNCIELPDLDSITDSFVDLFPNFSVSIVQICSIIYINKFIINIVH